MVEFWNPVQGNESQFWANLYNRTEWNFIIEMSYWELYEEN